MLSFSSLVFVVVVVGCVLADDCKKGVQYSWSIYQPLKNNVTSLVHRNTDCNETYCAGDSFIMTNTIFSDSTRTFNIGSVELQCTGIISSYFQCDVSFIVDTNPNTYHASGIINLAGNRSYLSLTGGSSYWLGIVGGVRVTMKPTSWSWDFHNCYATQSCTGGQIGYMDNNNGVDSYVPLYPLQPLNSSGVTNIFNNILISEDYLALLGTNVGRCTNLGDGRSECVWVVDFPDASNQLTLQGSILTASNLSYVTVTGGTGRFRRVKGGGPVSFPTNISLSFAKSSFNYAIFYGCNNTPSIFISLLPNNPVFQTFPPLDAFPGGVAGSGALTTWIDEGLTFGVSSNWSYIPTDARIVSLRGQCVLMNDLIRSLCEWTFIFTNATNTLNVVGSIIVGDPSPVEVVIVGGSGIWSAARGSGILTPQSWDFTFTVSSVPDPTFSASSSLLSSFVCTFMAFFLSCFLM